jgi:hypothetical protein
LLGVSGGSVGAGRVVREVVQGMTEVQRWVREGKHSEVAARSSVRGPVGPMGLKSPSGLTLNIYTLAPRNCGLV